MPLAARVLLAAGLALAVNVGLGTASADSQGVQTRPATGALEGHVRHDGSAPPPTAVRNTTDPDVCGHTQSLEDLIVSPATQGIANVIVAVDGVPRESWPAVEPDHLILDNRQCQFVPHAAVLTRGSVIEALNSDPTLHTAHFYGALEANLALPLEGLSVRRVVERTGLILVKCDVHGWMQAFVRVDEHPFHAVTGEDGTFRIGDLPAGRFELDVWHERLGRQRQAVTIEAGRTTRVSLTY